MRGWRRWLGRGWLVFVASALATLAVLTVFGLRSTDIRVFSLGVPVVRPVTVVWPSTPVCEGPIAAPSTAATVLVWGEAISGSPEVSAVVRSAGMGRIMARGPLMPSTVSPFEYRARLNRNVSGGRAFRVCLQATGGSFMLFGHRAVAHGVTMTGGPRRFQFSLILWSPPGTTFLGSLPTAFARASLFKLSWLRPWVFWLLCGLLLSTILLGSAAISAAARADEPDIAINSQSAGNSDSGLPARSIEG